MAIRIKCECGKAYDVPERRAAKSFKCYLCNRELTPTCPSQLLPSAGHSHPITSPGAVVQPSAAPIAPLATLNAAYNFTAAKLSAGMSDTEIEEELLARGIEGEVARKLIQRAIEQQQQARSQANVSWAFKNMMIGVGLCSVAIGIAVMSYQALNNYVVILEGILAWGVAHFVCGLGQWFRERAQ